MWCSRRRKVCSTFTLQLHGLIVCYKVKSSHSKWKGRRYFTDFLFLFKLRVKRIVPIVIRTMGCVLDKRTHKNERENFTLWQTLSFIPNRKLKFFIKVIRETQIQGGLFCISPGKAGIKFYFILAFFDPTIRHLEFPILNPPILCGMSIILMYSLSRK
jgi:hypothetical protein